MWVAGAVLQVFQNNEKAAVWCTNILRSKRSRVCLLWQLEREPKKWDEGEGKGQERNKISSLPLPPFLARPSTFIKSSIGNAWKAVYRQSGRQHHFFHYICQAAGYPSEIVIKVSKINQKNIKMFHSNYISDEVGPRKKSLPLTSTFIIFIIYLHWQQQSIGFTFLECPWCN